MMIIESLKKFSLVIALLVAAFLRFWQLGSIPAGLTPDEAALGYNAYSILSTGNDEWGIKLPIIFKSFGDFKPGLYVYASIPFVKIFGLTEFSTRAASALSGVIGVYLIYLISLRLFQSKKYAIICAFVASVNPWLIFFSRGAWESNFSLMLTLLGILFFTKIRDDGRYIIASAFFFGLTLIAYQGAKLSTLLTVLLLSVLYFREVVHLNKKYLASAFFLGLLIAMPIIVSFTRGQTFRLNIYSIFSYSRPVEEIQKINNQETVSNSLNFTLFHTESLNYFRAILGRYFNNFSPRFLFFDGDWANPISTPPYQGVMLISDLIFLPLGLLFVFQKRLGKPYLFILFWMALAPISSALSRDELNAVRDLNLAVPLVFLSAWGIYFSVNFLSKRKITNIIVSALVFLSFCYFADSYYIHTNAHNSNHWRYGYREAFKFIEPIKQQYTKVVFEQSFNQPYIYKLFYGPKNPLEFQRTQRLVDSEFKGDVGYVQNLDGVSFERLDWQVLKNNTNQLVVAAHTSVPPDIFAYPDKYILLHQIKYLNGRDVAFDIFEIK